MLPPTIEGETLGVATVRFQNGALGTITMTTLAYDGFPERIDVSGTKGSAMLVGDHLAHFTTKDLYEDEFGDLSGSAETHSNTSKDPAALVGDGHYGNIRDFVLAVREWSPPQVAAENHAMRIPTGELNRLLRDVHVTRNPSGGVDLALPGVESKMQTIQMSWNGDEVLSPEVDKFLEKFHEMRGDA
ncbi:MAG: hypothetical protein ABIY70_18640 [Capsulimonas sp.]|uniref:Gfo/Idh/MocA family protein n=1 Tax=Capsulimonas sp. TaxID=2494211 RepID=UPI003264B378